MYCYDENLTLIGKLENITGSYGERIFATRYVGSKLYMVTFRVTDPFFSINLTDPRNPTLLGALKIPGFSTYLHPYDQNTIIGVGR